MFRRRRGEDEQLDDVEGDEPATADDAQQARPAVRSGGPFDVDSAPVDDVARLDMGSMLVPVTEGLELRVDLDQNTNQLVSVTLASPSSAMQLLVFAAPRTSGIWDEVRTEIAESLTGSGGANQEVEGPFGVELRATVPTDVAGQFAPARFLGVDGPRWFLRAMIQGRAAVDFDSDPALLTAFGQVVVVRGGEAMAVRDALPLRLPPDMLNADGVPNVLGQDDAESEDDAPSLALPERGPEITETR